MGSWSASHWRSYRRDPPSHAPRATGPTTMHRACVFPPLMANCLAAGNNTVPPPGNNLACQCQFLAQTKGWILSTYPARGLVFTEQLAPATIFGGVLNGGAPRVVVTGARGFAGPRVMDAVFRSGLEDLPRCSLCDSHCMINRKVSLGGRSQMSSTDSSQSSRELVNSRAGR